MEEEENYLPFTEDGQQARSLRARTEVQTPLVDVNQNPPVVESPNAVPGMAAIPDIASEPYSPTEAVETPRMELDAEMLIDAPAEATEPLPQPSLEEIAVQPSTGILSGQPESEVTPVMSQQTSEVTSEEEAILQDHQGSEAAPTQLTQALRQGVDRLDGVPHAHLADQNVSKNSNEIRFVQDKMDLFLAHPGSPVRSTSIKRKQRKQVQVEKWFMRKKARR